MNWGTAERIFQRKPYLLDPYRCRSMKDAKELLAREGMPSAEQVLTAARLRAGMSMSEWEAYTGMSTKTMERKCKRVTPVRFGGLLALPRRVVVALAIIIILATFMACTPFGRSLAVRAYNAIVEVIDGILYVRSEENDSMLRTESIISSIEDTVTDYASIDDALEQINGPVLYFPDNVAKLNNIQLISNPIEGVYIDSDYLLKSDVKVTIEQSWESRYEDNVIMDGTQKHVQISLDNGMIIDGAYSSDDRIFIGVAVASNTAIRICVSNAKDVANVRDVLSSLVMG